MNTFLLIRMFQLDQCPKIMNIAKWSTKEDEKITLKYKNGNVNYERKNQSLDRWDVRLIIRSTKIIWLKSFPLMTLCIELDITYFWDNDYFPLHSFFTFYKIAMHSWAIAIAQDGANTIIEEKKNGVCRYNKYAKLQNNIEKQ